ncbi:DUF2637 domain-containing protein [Pseudonocardia sp. NPDC049635]|uniref:DUF2637 domain-containing protein n=1 Tax=Pseudonocardia sp. NPDC049635 TaxID=3155506 RepID=UPI0033CA9B4C
MKLEYALYGLMAAVAAAAAVLSFTTLHDLAAVSGFAPWAGWTSPGTAWLLPVTIDAGAAAGSLVWLSRTGRARVFGRGLALALLGLSVVGNGLGHHLVVEQARPGWWIVVLVSAVPPAVLGAVVHLAMLCGRPDETDRADGHTGDRTGPRPELTEAGERQLVAEIAAAVRAGGPVPSSNELLTRWAIGRGRANRILREARRPELKAVTG